MDRRIAATALLIALLVTSAGCGSDGRPGVPLGEGALAGVPVPPSAVDAGTRAEGGIVGRSYFVRERPAGVLDFYRDVFEAEGVPVLEAPGPVGRGAWRGWWLVDGRKLLVSAVSAPTVEGHDVTREGELTQLDLELWPIGGADPHDPPVSVGATAGR